MIVILNDNNMSIAPNVWAISNYFTEIFTTPTLQKLRSSIWDLTGKLDDLGDRIRRAASRIEGGVKAILTPGMLFEALGFKYYGPINGHNIQQLVRILNVAKNLHGPVLLHVMTNKGKGYIHAEQDKQFLHAIGAPIDKITGKAFAKPAPATPPPPSYTKIFGEAMLELCKKDPAIVGITAAMPDGTGLDILQKELPDRVIDVGIAEGHAVTMAAGMATEGIKPVCAIYSSFLQRAFDHIVHDSATQHLHVVFAIDRAGLVGADGPTHHGVLDLAYLRIIQNMVVMAPKDEQELRDMLYSSLYHYTNGPVAIRYPRGNAVGVPISPMKAIPLGSWERLRSGTDVAILAIGKMVQAGRQAVEILSEDGISAELINARFVKPLDEEMLSEICRKFDKIITIEDGQIQGGFGSAVLEHIAAAGYNRSTDILMHGIPDIFVEHGTQEELLRSLQLDGAGIAATVKKFLGATASHEESLASR